MTWPSRREESAYITNRATSTTASVRADYPTSLAGNDNGGSDRIRVRTGPARLSRDGLRAHLPGNRTRRTYGDAATASKGPDGRPYDSYDGHVARAADKKRTRGCLAYGYDFDAAEMSPKILRDFSKKPPGKT